MYPGSQINDFHRPYAVLCDKTVKTQDYFVPTYQMWMDGSQDWKNNVAQSVIPQGSTAVATIGIGRVFFERQPPSNLRKSNFFNFIICLFDRMDKLIQVMKATFIRFIEKSEEPSAKKTNNGIHYRLVLRYASGIEREEDVFLRLIDSTTREAIAYEGLDRNPDMQRVLLTHEVMCTRCSEKKSCGNKNETPSDPQIVDKYYLKFFLKCNQNCLKNAGNPRDVRRFQLAFSSSSDLENGVVFGSSNDIFVHNNSKHGRKTRKMECMSPVPTSSTDSYSLPYLDFMSPNEGSTVGHYSSVIIGRRFFSGLQAYFGPTPVLTEVLTSSVIRVRVPPRNIPGQVEVTLRYKQNDFSQNATVFIYTVSPEYVMDREYEMLYKLTPRHLGDSEKLSKTEMLKRIRNFVEHLVNNPPPPRPHSFLPPSQFAEMNRDPPSVYPMELCSTELHSPADQDSESPQGTSGYNSSSSTPSGTNAACFSAQIMNVYSVTPYAVAVNSMNSGANPSFTSMSTFTPTSVPGCSSQVKMSEDCYSKS